MGMISTIATLGGLLRPATELTRTLRGDRAATEAMDHQWQKEVLKQLAAEFAQTPQGPFDRLVNGLNRLPRPALALGTLGLFVFAMLDPVRFASRMQGLALVPEPLWWLLGAIVSFYFGAREMHYLRTKRPQISLSDVRQVADAQREIHGMNGPSQAIGLGGFWNWSRKKAVPKGRPEDPEYNAALEDWKSKSGRD